MFSNPILKLILDISEISLFKFLSEIKKLTKFNEKIDAIITTGGTGLTGRDITPEALEEIADKHIPGFGEVFRTISLKTVGTSAIQSRAWKICFCFTRFIWRCH